MSYINKRQKEECLIFAAFASAFDNKIENWEKYGERKDRMRWLKTGRTYIKKVLDSYFEGVDQEQVNGVVKLANKMTIATRLKNEAIKEYDDLKKIDSMAHIESNDFFDILEQSICECVRCEKTGEEANNCNLKRIYLKYGIDIVNENKESVCPYKYKGDE